MVLEVRSCSVTSHTAPLRTIVARTMSPAASSPSICEWKPRAASLQNPEYVSVAGPTLCSTVPTWTNGLSSLRLCAPIQVAATPGGDVGEIAGMRHSALTSKTLLDHHKYPPSLAAE